MVFFLEITNIWHMSRDFWFTDFFLEILKIHRLLWIFLWILVVFNMIHQNSVYQKTNKERATNKIWTKVKKINKHLPPPPKKSIDYRRYGFKIYSLERNPWAMTMTQQLTKSRDFRHNYLCDFHLCNLQYLCNLRLSNI